MLCNRAPEDVRHFLLECPALAVCRDQLDRVLGAVLPSAGVPGRELLIRVQAGGDGWLGVILGSGLASLPSDPADYMHFGLAHWLVDKASKNFLVAIWTLRETLLGSLRVIGGRLVREASKKVFEAEVAKQRTVPVHVQDVNKYKHFWSLWVPRKFSRWSTMAKSTRNGKAAFYVVTGGLVDGVFYAWRHAFRSFTARPEARVRGFDTLRDAEQAAMAMGCGA